MKTTTITWIVAVFGIITFLPLFAAQFVMLLKPRSQLARDLIIGKGQDWRDRTHFKSALAFAWADLIIIFPLLIISSILVLTGNSWGFIIWAALGVLSVYFSILFWVMEKEYTYKSVGWIAYYSYFWGFFLYWGLAAIIYSMWQLSQMD